MEADWKKYKPESFEYNGRWIKNWFSNMEPSFIKVDGKSYKSVENYYQSMKTLDPEMLEAIEDATPSGSKQIGKKVTIRQDWADIKYDIMKKALWAKWSKPEYREALLETGDEMIIEWNNWGDRTWGVDIRDNKGKNWLGQALMEIREELKLTENA